MLNTDILLLVLRIIVGLLFFGHGTQKLFGWWGGHGLQGTGQFYQSVDLAPGTFWALIAGLGETLGGLGLALGLLTPIAGAAITSVMLTAILKVHLDKGIWNSNGGFEYPLVNLAIATLIGLTGPGVYSLDNVLNISYPMPLTFLIAILVGVLGVAAALFIGPTIGESQEMRSAEN